MKKLWLSVIAMGSVIFADTVCAVETDISYKKIAVADYKDKVSASWLGQIIGNTYGLSYEFKFIDQPGPNKFPYGFGEYLEKVKEVNGAFSDDDTDIEYMYLLQMEKQGIEPTYRDLANAWKYHVREKVWVANRQAVALMHAGYSPPLTGHKDLNPQWFQIDPQLVNEIWAVTAPGMITYAADKTRWAASVTSDDFGADPAVMYSAMFSAAFFETDVRKLIDIGLAALPRDSRFTAIVQHMKKLHSQYPNDWQKARAIMAQNYYKQFDYNKNAWIVVDANLNGACGILALLYGEGDFQKTLDMASAMGFDADNQAATMSGLLGIAGGSKILPKPLLFPLDKTGWKLPYNDRYINISRFDLPDASLADMSERIALQGEKIILASGGKKITEAGVDYYLINTSVAFTPPVELATAPALFAEQGVPFGFSFIQKDLLLRGTLKISNGKLPDGLIMKDGNISGVPVKTGEFSFTLALNIDKKVAEQTYVIQVHSPNLAVKADAVLHNIKEANKIKQLTALVRDGDTTGATYYSNEAAVESKEDFYGYEWSQPQTISVIRFNPGYPQEFGGWFTSLSVEYLNSAGSWVPVKSVSITPAINFDNSQWLKGMGINHTLVFPPVTTRAIRIYGAAGGVEKDKFNGGGKEFYTSISELSVHSF